jgi:NADPH:quinone reductase-like Zn-dependent oxidoreductase
MKAVRIHQYGGPEVLVYEEIEQPQIADDEVLIQVYAAGVNPVDWKIREGYLKNFLHHTLPLTLGWDVSGVVTEVGSQVSQFQVGDEVYSRPNIERDGAYAEFIAVKASEVALKPKSIDHLQAAAVPLVALTAWQSLFDVAQLSAGQRVLIHAAAGGVGTFAIQLAKTRGAYVVGTASAQNRDFVLSLGADEAINYQTTPFEQAVSEVDVVFDTIGGDVQDRSWQVLKPGGILVSIVKPPSKEEASAHNCRGEYVFVQPNATQLTEIAQLIDTGKMKSIVETVLPLDQATQAHQLSQKGRTRGKIILQVV